MVTVNTYTEWLNAIKKSGHAYLFIYKIESKIPSDLKKDTESLIEAIKKDTASLIEAIKGNLDVENDPDILYVENDPNIKSNSKPENLIIETIKIYLYKFVQALYSANISQDIKEALFPKNLKQANQNKTFSYIDSYYQITEDRDCGSLSNEKLLKKLEGHIDTETNDYNVLKKDFSDAIFNIKMFNFITNQEILQKNIKSIIDKSKNSKEFTFCGGWLYTSETQRYLDPRIFDKNIESLIESNIFTEYKDKCNFDEFQNSFKAYANKNPEESKLIIDLIKSIENGTSEKIIKLIKNKSPFDKFKICNIAAFFCIYRHNTNHKQIGDFIEILYKHELITFDCYDNLFEGEQKIQFTKRLSIISFFHIINKDNKPNYKKIFKEHYSEKEIINLLKSSSFDEYYKTLNPVDLFI